MPAALPYSIGNRLYDWKYESEPEPHMDGRRVFHARGKLLGGSSSINGMIFQRGNPMDFERWAGRQGHGVLGLRALPALLQADGDLPRRRRRVARRQRAADHGARTGDQPAVRGVLRGGAAGRPPAHRRRERLPPGGLRALRPQRLPRPAAERRPGLPAPGHGPAQPDHRDAGDGHRPGHRGQTPGRPGSTTADRSRAPPRAGRRGDPLRRRDQLTAAADALRHRPPRAPRGARHRRGRGPARRGQQPAGPPRGLHPVRLQAAGLHRAVAQAPAQAADRRRVAVPAPRRRAPRTTSRPAASSAATTWSTTRT